MIVRASAPCVHTFEAASTPSTVTQKYSFEVYRAKGDCVIALSNGEEEIVLKASMLDLTQITHGTYLFSLQDNSI